MSAAVIKNRIKDSLGTIQSTWECDFLNNLNKSIDLNYCLEITNNLYGNGYILDCYQITTASSLVGRFGCFEGPLDLVSLINLIESKVKAINVKILIGNTLLSIPKQYGQKL